MPAIRLASVAGRYWPRRRLNGPLLDVGGRHDLAAKRDRTRPAGVLSPVSSGPPMGLPPRGRYAPPGPSLTWKRPSAPCASIVEKFAGRCRFLKTPFVVP